MGGIKNTNVGKRMIRVFPKIIETVVSFGIVLVFHGLSCDGGRMFRFCSTFFEIQFTKASPLGQEEKNLEFPLEHPITKTRMKRKRKESMETKGKKSETCSR